MMIMEPQLGGWGRDRLLFQILSSNQFPFDLGNKLQTDDEVLQKLHRTLTYEGSTKGRSLGHKSAPI